MPGTFKAHGQQSNPSTPEDASPLSGNGFMLPGSCLVSPSALTRKKERSEPASTTNASKLKSRHEDAPQLRKAPQVPKKDVTSQSETATPPSEVASTAVPRTSSTLCSEGSLSERQHPGRPAQAQLESRNEVSRGRCDGPRLLQLQPGEESSQQRFPSDPLVLWLRIGDRRVIPETRTRVDRQRKRPLYTLRRIEKAC